MGPDHKSVSQRHHGRVPRCTRIVATALATSWHIPFHLGRPHVCTLGADWPSPGFMSECNYRQNTTSINTSLSWHKCLMIWGYKTVNPWWIYCSKCQGRIITTVKTSLYSNYPRYKYTMTATNNGKHFLLKIHQCHSRNSLVWCQWDEVKVIYPRVSMIWIFHWNLLWNYWAFF